MKRTYKKLLALFLSALLIVGLLPTYAFAQGTETRSDTEMKNDAFYGYIPVEIPGSRAVSEAYKSGDMETYYRLSGKAATRATLPSKYDSRDYSYVTSVKNQNPYGSCWAHAAMGSV